MIFYGFAMSYLRSVLFFSVAGLAANSRPKRSNQGQGGHLAQLQAISAQISGKGKQKKPGRNDILADIPVNAMAPSGESEKIVPARADPPLHDAAPKPARVNGEHGSVFGFRPYPNENPDSGMSNAIASHIQEKAQDSERDSMCSNVAIFFFSFLTLISDASPAEDNDQSEQGII